MVFTKAFGFQKTGRRWLVVDDIEMARPKGLLILFTSFKLLDILDDAGHSGMF